MTPILRTLAYHYLFQDPLTIEQIHEFLITPVPLSLTSVRRSVEQLSRQHQITRRGPYCTLLHVTHAPESHMLKIVDEWSEAEGFRCGVSPRTVRGGATDFSPWGSTQQNVRQHADRMKASQDKLAIARRAAKVISFVPWVKLVAVTGALAMKNADESDDIDLMIVTRRNRLWLTRPLVMLLVSLFFKRRKANLSNWTNSANLTNALCLNLWLDEDALGIPKDQRNLYTAHELAQMKPLVNRDGTYERMMSVNKWGREFLANVWKGVEGQGPRAKGQGKPNSILTLLNKVSYQLQICYMKPKITTERVSLSAAYFHPGDRSQEILVRYNQRCGYL